MKVPSKQLGSIGLFQTLCDNPKCRAVTILIRRDQHVTVPAKNGKERVGEFCSNQCLVDTRAAQEEGTFDMTADIATAPEGQKEGSEMTETGAAPAKAATKKAATKKSVAKGTAKKHAASKGTKRKRSGESQASLLLALIKRSGGATMAELREVSPNSAGSLIFALRKAGEKIVVKDHKDGVKRYVVDK